MADSAAVFTGIPSDRCDEFWERAEPFIWRAILLTNGDETLLSVKNGIRNDERQLWMAFADEAMTKALMAVTTRTVRFGSGIEKCEIVHCGGDDMGRWLGFLPLIEAWAKGRGCVGMRIIGRRGWARILPDYQEVATVMERTLEPVAAPGVSDGADTTALPNLAPIG